MIYEVEVWYNRPRGSWSDYYIVEASSVKEAVKKLVDYLDGDESTVTARKIDISRPYLVKEG